LRARAEANFDYLVNQVNVDPEKSALYRAEAAQFEYGDTDPGLLDEMEVPFSCYRFYGYGWAWLGRKALLLGG
jgi:hypothetical protein